MESEKKVSRKLAVVFRLVDGKIESEGRFENCTPMELSLAIAYLEMHKKKLVEALEKTSGAGVKKG